MKLRRTFLFLILACFFILAGNTHAVQNIALEPGTGLKFKFSDDFACGIMGSITINSQLDQMDNFLNPLDESQKVFVPLEQSGFSGWSVAPWYTLELVKISNINIHGGGEIFIVSRKLNEDILPDAPDYFEVRPTGWLGFSTVFENSITFTFNNRFERRLIRSPQISGMSASTFRYSSHFSIAPKPFTQYKIIPSIAYTAYTQKGAPHLSAAGINVSSEPINTIAVDLFYKLLWEPGGKNRSCSKIGMILEYTIDLSK